jgi:hypothetical protein
MCDHAGAGLDITQLTPHSLQLLVEWLRQMQMPVRMICSNCNGRGWWVYQGNNSCPSDTECIQCRQQGTVANPDKKPDTPTTITLELIHDRQATIQWDAETRRIKAA